MSDPLLSMRVSVSVHALDLVGTLMHDGQSHQYHHRPHCILMTNHLGCHHLHGLFHELGGVAVPLHYTLQEIALLVGHAIPLAKGL